MIVARRLYPLCSGRKSCCCSRFLFAGGETKTLPEITFTAGTVLSVGANPLLETGQPFASLKTLKIKSEIAGLAEIHSAVGYLDGGEKSAELE